MCDAEIGKVLQVKGKKALVEVNGSAREVIVEFVDVKKNDKILCKGNIAIEKLEE
jgi:hydrogenase maturation factor